MSTDCCMIMTTFPDDESARQVIDELLTMKVAACIQTLPITSQYRWRGAVNQESELLTLIKATTENYATIESLIKKRHPYECPEIIQVPITKGSADYLDWLRTESTTTPSSDLPTFTD
jgi:periplasmic divalent cation tolerance protein